MAKDRQFINYTSLNQLLKKSEVKSKTDFITHTSVTLKKSYNLNREDIPMFYKLYSKAKLRSFTEVPRSSYHSMFRVDIDIAKNKDEYKGEKRFYSEDDIKTVITLLQSQIRKSVECTDDQLVCSLFEKDIYEDVAKGKFKGGFHLQFPHIFTVSKDMMYRIIEPIMNEVKDITGFEFDNVYTKPWLVYGSSKSNDSKPYILTKNYNIDYNEMTTFETFQNYKLFDIKENQIEITPENVDELLPRIMSITPFNRKCQEYKPEDIPRLVFIDRKPKINDNRDVEEKIIECKNIIPLLSNDRCDDYNDWLKVGWCLFSITEGCDEGLQLWDDWSRNSDKYDPGSCDDQWNKMIIKEDGLTLGSLKFWAKQDSPEEYAKLFERKKEKVDVEEEIIFNDTIDIKKEDNYYWVDFERRYTNTIFNSFDELKENIIKDLPRVLTKITLGGGYYIKKEHNDSLCDMIDLKKLKRISFTYYTSFKNKKGQNIEDTVKISLDDIYLECKLPLYSHPDMILDKSIKTNAYNIFKGIQATKTAVIDIELIDKFLKHMKTVICNDVEKSYHFFISWMRWITIYPHIKSKVLVFLFSPEGYGKSTIASFLSKYIFGDTASHISPGLDAITGPFNKHLLGKLFCQIEELPTTSELFHKQFDIMKTLITDDKMYCNAKGVDAHKVNNYMNFMACSNNKYSLRMPNTDTRYFVLEIKNKMNQDYWNKYYSDFQNQKFADMLYSYFLKTNDDDYVSFRGRPKIPMTELKEQLIDFSLPSYDRFYKDIMEGDYKLSRSIFKEPFTYNKKTYNYASTLNNIFTEYSNWGALNDQKDLRRRYLEFTLINTKKIRFIDLQEKITNIDTLEFEKR